METTQSIKDFLANGYYVLPCALGDDLRNRMRQDCCGRMFHMEQTEPSLFSPSGEARTLGVDPLNTTHRELIRHGALIAGMPDVRYLAGAIIPKYPGEGERAWHVDWWAWNDPVTRRDYPPAIGVLFYLDTATIETGMLHVVPESHRRPISRNAQIGLRLKAGTAVILDSRLLHSVGPNTTQSVIRFCVTIWYMVKWSELSDRVKATVRQSAEPLAAEILGDLYPHYTGDAEPYTHVKVATYE